MQKKYASEAAEEEDVPTELVDESGEEGADPHSDMPAEKMRSTEKLTELGKSIRMLFVILLTGQCSYVYAYLFETSTGDHMGRPQGSRGVRYRCCFVDTV